VSELMLVGVWEVQYGVGVVVQVFTHWYPPSLVHVNPWVVE